MTVDGQAWKDVQRTWDGNQRLCFGIRSNHLEESPAALKRPCQERPGILRRGRNGAGHPSLSPHHSMDIRPFQVDEAMLIKSVRLRSLIDAPYAFGAGSYDAEAAHPDSYWHQLAAQVGGQDPQWRDKCVSYVVMDKNEACGTATCFLCPQVERRAYLTAAWIDPRYRRRGLGRRLIEAAMAWSAGRGADHLRLWVDDTNPEAADFYRSLGFVATGEIRPIAPGASEQQCSFERRFSSG